MHIPTQLSRLREEIKEIGKANEIYKANKHHRTPWYKEQQELRRQRLEVIKLELMQLLPKETATAERA
ncbi:MAG TPA: hypothetical protein VGF44_10450 [Terriglobales bacterium]|jgi:hypothetical protein